MKIRSIPTGRQRRRRRIRTLILAVAIMLAASLAFGICLYVYFSLKLPKLKTISDYRPALPTIMYDKDGVEAARFYTENREMISIDQVPRMVIDAVLAIEDSGYYRHKGIDYLGIMRAMVKNMLAGRVVQGGSTITQQVAKSLLLSNERTYSRKIKEAILARRMDKRFTKDEILGIYLNQSYFGFGCYGIESAAMQYFSKHVYELSLAEAALLAGLPKAPSAYDPTRSPDKALARRNQVLTRMEEEKFITAQERSEASSQPLGLSARLQSRDDPAAYFSEEVRRHLYSKYGEEALYRGGLKVYTTLDSRLQLFAQDALRNGLRELDKRQGYRGPQETVSAENYAAMSATLKAENGLADYLPSDREAPWDAGRIMRALVLRADGDAAYLDMGGVAGCVPVEEMRWARKPDPKVEGTEVPVKRADEVLRPGAVILVRFLGKSDLERGFLFALEQDPKVEGALVCLDAPTGQVYAIIGGFSYSRSEFNRATQARRQPGSAFKPIVYSAAMDNGFTPSSIIIDSPIIYDDPSQELKWKPSNYEEVFYGPTTLRTGITKSRNVITIKLVQKLGIQAVTNYARRFGFERDVPQDLSISLGSMGLTPLELTSAFTVFSNLGLRASPWFITKVVDRDGNILEQGSAEMVRTLSEDTAFIMQNLLRGVVQSGTGWRAKSLGHPSGGKTGTTNDMVNAWYVGFTPRMVTGVWVGFDEEATMGVDETGSRAAAPIWVEFMTRALEGQPVLPFPPPPPGIEMVKIEPESGLLAGPGVDKFIYEAFKIGTAPREYARPAIRRGAEFSGQSFAPGYMPQTEIPGILPRDF